MNKNTVYYLKNGSYISLKDISLGIIIAIISILLLCGCSNEKCVKSHQETKTCVRPQCMFMNKNPICINQIYTCQQTICDEYEGEDNE